MCENPAGTAQVCPCSPRECSCTPSDRKTRAAVSSKRNVAREGITLVDVRHRSSGARTWLRSRAEIQASKCASGERYGHAASGTVSGPACLAALTLCFPLDASSYFATAAFGTGARSATGARQRTKTIGQRRLLGTSAGTSKSPVNWRATDGPFSATGAVTL